MSQTPIVPAINPDILQEAVNASALKGALKTIEEFYENYNSPYRKLIKEHLDGQGITGNIKLPKIIALINQHLNAEVTKIANSAIAQIYAPMVTNILLDVNKEVKFSDILKQFITAFELKEDDSYSCDIKRQERFDWLDISLSCTTREHNMSYSVVFHKKDWGNTKSDKDDKRYVLLSLPRDDRNFKQTMILTSNGVKLELPFVPDVLSNPFISYLASLVIAKSVITMDYEDFDENMFPEDEEHCHCN